MPTAPGLPLTPLAQGLGDRLRWAILRELATGDSLMVVEIAQKIGKSATLISKHLGVLRKAGMVAIKQRLHFIPRQFLVEPGRRIVDFGHCVLRLDADAG